MVILFDAGVSSNGGAVNGTLTNREAYLKPQRLLIYPGEDKANNATNRTSPRGGLQLGEYDNMATVAHAEMLLFPQTDHARTTETQQRAQFQG